MYSSYYSTRNVDYVSELLQRDLWCLFRDKSSGQWHIRLSSRRTVTQEFCAQLRAICLSASYKVRERRERASHLIEAGLHAEPGGQRREVVRAGRSSAADARASCRVESRGDESVQLSELNFRANMER